MFLMTNIRVQELIIFTALVKCSHLTLTLNILNQKHIFLMLIFYF